MGSVTDRYAKRRESVAREVSRRGLDAVLITHLTHVRYLTNFSGSNAALVIGRDGSASIATDGRYTTQIANEVPDLRARIARQCAAELLGELGFGARVGFEADYVTVAEGETLAKRSPEGVSLSPVTGLIEPLRLIKDEDECEALRHVADVASSAFEDMLAAGEIAAGRTERDVAADLEYRMRRGGSEHVSFDTIVASGINSALPHHSADDTVIQRGDIVTLDFGAHIAGYNSDMTRTVVVGEVSDFARKIYEVVHASQQAGVEAVRAGAACSEVDRACRDIIVAAGYGEYFVHSTGHGVGLDVHEPPAASTGSSDTLAAGMTVTVEPGVYIPGRGGVRIEDTLIVTADGSEIITNVSKKLTVV